MGWVEVEAFWLFCPYFADELVWREPLEGFQSAAEIIGCDQVAEMAAQVFVAVVVEALDGGFLDRAVHALDLAIGPWMFRLGCAVLDVGLCAGVSESMRPEEF